MLFPSFSFFLSSSFFLFLFLNENSAPLRRNRGSWLGYEEQHLGSCWQRAWAPSLGRGVGLVMVSGGFEGLMDLWGKVGAVPRFSEREEGR